MPDTLPTPYTGIGSRETPNHVQSTMAHLAMSLAAAQCTLRSGGAEAPTPRLSAGRGKRAACAKFSYPGPDSMITTPRSIECQPGRWRWQRQFTRPGPDRMMPPVGCMPETATRYLERHWTTPPVSWCAGPAMAPKPRPSVDPGRAARAQPSFWPRDLACQSSTWPITTPWKGWATCWSRPVAGHAGNWPERPETRRLLPGQRDRKSDDEFCARAWRAAHRNDTPHQIHQASDD